MLGDPYARMISVIRDQSREQSGLGESQSAGLGANPCKLRLGQVTRKVPLEVTVAGVMYHAGECMVYTDGNTYKCLSDTVYSPEEYGQAWEVV